MSLIMRNVEFVIKLLWHTVFLIGNNSPRHNQGRN